MNKSMHGSSVRSFSINNLNAKLEILLRFRVNDPWSVGCFLATAVFTRMRLNGFLRPEFGKRTGGLAGSMLSLNPVEQIYDIVLCASL